MSLFTELKSPPKIWRAFLFTPGSVLLSHSLTAIVSSALEGLTSVFGMGTGVSPPEWPPETQKLIFEIRKPNLTEAKNIVKPHG